MSSAQLPRPHSRARGILATGLAISLILAAGPVGALPPDSLAAKAEEETKSKRRAVAVASILLALVTVTGLSLIGLIVILGRRTRRMAKQPLPGGRPLDELWFLRKLRGSARPPPPEDDGEPPAAG